MTMMNPRFQRGEDIVVDVEIARRPDILPAVVVTPPDGPPHDPSPAIYAYPGTYRFTFRSPPGSALGTYRLSFSWVQDGQLVTSDHEIDLVAGGDSGGNIIALYHYRRPEGSYCVAQLSTGRLVQGRNPHL